MDLLSTMITRKLHFFFVALILNVLYTDGSPLEERSTHEQGSCLGGWFHYNRFCMTRGVGTTEREVALYCDRRKAIGISGLCIRRASYPEEESNESFPSDLSAALLDGFQASEPKGKTDVSESDGERGVDLDNDIFKDVAGVDEMVCPKGWTHHMNMCVYKPVSVQQQCHQLDAVDLLGLCVKHADTNNISRQTAAYLQKGKRICCCAHVKARSNHYGC